MIAAPPIAPPDPAGVVPDAARARLILWLAFVTMLLSVSIGLSWDAAWHTTRRFESAF